MGHSVYPIMCLRAILVISGTYWFKTFSRKFYIYFLASVICLLAAILENGRHRHQGAVRRWLHPQICSLYIGLPLCQNWCFYQKMHNRLAYPPHYYSFFEYNIFSRAFQRVNVRFRDNRCCEILLILKNWPYSRLLTCRASNMNIDIVIFYLWFSRIVEQIYSAVLPIRQLVNSMGTSLLSDKWWRKRIADKLRLSLSSHCQLL